MSWSLDLEGGGNPNLFHYILSSLVNVRLHTENWLCNLPGSALKVPVGGGGWWWLETEYSDCLWLSFSLALAKPNNNNSFVNTFKNRRESMYFEKCNNFV